MHYFLRSSGAVSVYRKSLLLTKCTPAANNLEYYQQQRGLTYKSTGKPVTAKAMDRMLKSSKFLNKMSVEDPMQPGVRICPLDVQQDTELTYPTTAYECFKHAQKQNQVGLSPRANGYICGWIDPNTTQVKYITYDDFFAEAQHISSAFIELGCGAKDFAAVSYVNSKEFLEISFGIMAQRLVLQPLYPNLDISAVTHVLQQGTPKIFLCDSEEKAKMVLDRSKDFPSVKTIVVGKEVPGRDLIAHGKSVGVTVLSMSDLMKLGKHNPHEDNPPKPEDIFTLIYTSGTTGVPKGAIVTHDCISRAFHSVNETVGPLRPKPGIYTFSYMPTGHIYEMLFELLVMAEGGTIMCWRGDIKKLVEDMQIIKPHYIPMVQRIMNKIYDGVQEKLLQSPFKKRIFDYAYSKKLAMLKKGIVRHDTIYDKYVFKKIRAVLGGQVESIISSSAPLNREIMEFFKIVFGSHVSEVYGSTETLIALGTSPYDHTGGHLGGPFPSVEVKLIDVPELGYQAKNNVGEICIKSPIVFKGYYKNEEATKSTLVDGWVVTGDVGRWTERGTLQIIDRKKDIFKLSQGEYIAPEKVESVYSRVDQVANVFVEGRGDQRFCVAIVVPDESLFRDWCKTHGFDSSLPLTKLCSDVHIRKAFLEELRNFGTAHDLGNLQQIRNIYLESEPFSLQNGLLTSTLKVKRNVTRDRYKDIVDQLYVEGSLVDKEL